MKWAEVESALYTAIDRTSQAEVAKAVGVSESTLSRWLSRESVPTGARRERLFLWAESLHAPAAAPVEMPAQLYGQTIEVEALLRYVLARQEALRDTLKGAMDPMPLAGVASTEARAKRRAPGR